MNVDTYRKHHAVMQQLGKGRCLHRDSRCAALWGKGPNSHRGAANAWDIEEQSLENDRQTMKALCRLPSLPRNGDVAQSSFSSSKHLLFYSAASAELISGLTGHFANRTRSVILVSALSLCCSVCLLLFTVA